jgi:hypothetical protein
MENNDIKFDILKIDAMLEKENIYEEGDNKFQFCKDYNPDNQLDQDEKIDIPKYIAKINSKSFKYLGILSKNLKKESYGYNYYGNGDEYIGQWKNDKKDGHGIYFFKENEGDEIKEIYVGEFKNNKKSGEGIYFHMTKLGQEEDICIPIDFSLAIGQFNDDNFSKGIIISMKDGKRKIYKGTIDKEGNKYGKNTELYEDDNKIFHGIYEKNIMKEGRIIIMKNGRKENGYYFNKIKKDQEDINFRYEKEEEDDDIYIKRLNEFNETFNYDAIKNLFMDIMMIKIKVNSSKSFDYMKNLNYDTDIKLQLKGRYGKYLYC